MPSYRGYVYLIGSTRFGWYKIGRSRTAEIRVQALGVLLPFKIEVFAIWMTDNPEALEAAMHERYSRRQINGEWFCFSREKLKEVMAGTYHVHAVSVTGQDVCNFSNVPEDVLASSKKSVDGLSYMQWVAQYLKDSGLEETPENVTKARHEVTKLFKHRRRLARAIDEDRQQLV